MHDYADKGWLRKHRRPLWQCIVQASISRMNRTGRMLQRYDVLRRGIQIRIENGLRYIVPAPTQHR